MEDVVLNPDLRSGLLGTGATADKNIFSRPASPSTTAEGDDGARRLQATLAQSRASTFGTALVWGKSYLANTGAYGFRTVPSQPKAATTNYCSDPNVVRVAIIDSGLDVNHQGISCNAPSPSQLGLAAEITTESANGRCRGASFDDVPGGMERWYEPANLGGHGTEVYGIVDATIQAAAAATASTGLRDPNSVEIPVCYLIGKIFDNVGGGQFMFVALKAVEWALSQNARVINLSFTTPSMNANAAAAFANVYSSGALVVAAAGNEGTSIVNYPGM
jgi:Subtilase family